jgi:hypothetical protein
MLESGYQYRYLEDQGNFVYLQKDRNYDPLTFYPEFSGDVSVRNTIRALYTQYASTHGKKFTYVSGLRYEFSNRELTISSASQPFGLALLYFLQPVCSTALRMPGRRRLPTIAACNVQPALS